MTTWLVAAFVLGLTGSLHCMGMCGPIAFALPVNRQNNLTKFTGISLYNLGRITTYSTLGLLFGFFGKGLKVAGVLQGVSIVLGVVIILMVLLPSAFERWLSMNSVYNKFSSKIKAALSKLFNMKSNTALYSLGLLNGLLPCGLVFMAVFGALENGSALSGATFMLFFGLGTVPAMFALPWVAQKITISFRSKLRKLVPFVMIFFGCVFVLRGMNLNIPYISPGIEMKEEVQTLDCCSSKSKCEPEND